MTLLSDGEREQYVATVQDLSELQLLQGRFGHQLLHDALTGVANRLYFESALETRLGRAAPDASITLCCLNLDGFSMLNEGLGHEVGDQLLRTVAKRLEGVMAEEKALVARIGGAEFAILVEDGQGTPDIPQLVARINDALAEPEYINGRGVAVGATVGAIRSPAGRMSGAELFRAADAALHSARAAGRRQWTRYDPVQDERLRQAYRDAAALPGAFESGELTLSYQPVVRLKDRATVGLRAGLCWSGRAGGPLGDNETMELAERAGHSVLLGPWTLEQACQNLALCQLHADGEPDSVLRIRLTRFQSADDDLVAAVLKATEAGGVEPHQLQLGFDTGAVLEEFGSSADNLEVVSDIGMHTALWRFNGGPRELAMLEGSSARSVILADPFGDREHAEGSYVRRATASLVCQLKELDVEVSVDGVGSESDAEWWAGIGLDTATGQLFGEPVAPEKLLTGNGPVASG
jgi:diguanylate cyclase (GGDEF)-like protein